MFLLSNSLIPALTVSQHNVTFCASRHLSDENKSISKREKNENTVRCGFSCRRWLISLAFRSGRSEQPHLANQRHVPPVCGGQRRGTTPGWQEAQIQHQDQEQQLVTKVQWNIPIVSNRELPLCLELCVEGGAELWVFYNFLSDLILHHPVSFAAVPSNQHSVCCLHTTKELAATFLQCHMIPLIHQQQFLQLFKQWIRCYCWTSIPAHCAEAV